MNWGEKMMCILFLETLDKLELTWWAATTHDALK